MPKLSGTLEALTPVAERQEGFVSANQAADVGVPRPALVRAASRGFLERERWGVYRLTHWPPARHASIWRALLWAQVRRGTFAGVVSHRTALQLHGASLDNPPRIDITLPRSFKRILRRPKPRDVNLHFRDLNPTDVESVDGIPATTIFRSVFDLLVDRVALDSVQHVLNSKRFSTELLRLRPFFEMDPRLLDEAVRIRCDDRRAAST
mgnify:CR=1 FL=1